MALKGSSLTALVRLENVSEELFEEVSGKFDGSYKSFSGAGSASVSLSKMVHKASTTANLFVDVFGSGGALSSSYRLAAELTKLISKSAEDGCLDTVAQAIRATLMEMEQASSDAIYGYEVVPMDEHLGLASASTSSAEFSSLVDRYQTIMDEKARVDGFKFKYGAYYGHLEEYLKKLKQTDPSSDVEDRLSALEKEYETERGIDIRPYKVLSTPNASLSVLPNHLGRWLVPTLPVAVAGSVHGHHLSATSASQDFVMPLDVSGLALEVRTLSIPHLFTWKPGMLKFEPVEGNDQSFSWYRANGVPVQVTSDGAPVPFQFAEDGKRIRCEATALAGKTVRITLTVDHTHVSDRLLHRAQPFSTVFRLTT